MPSTPPSVTDGVRRLLTSRGLNPRDPSLRDTPDRVWKAFQEMTEGYEANVQEILSKQFEADHDELVVLRGIRFTSLCEHHILPFSGVAHVGYIPAKNKVVGLSKLARLVEAFAKRLQLQERMTREIVDALDENLTPLGSGCVVQATHSCMGCRGVRQPDAEMRTSKVSGVLMSDPSARAEFFEMVR